MLTTKFKFENALSGKIAPFLLHVLTAPIMISLKSNVYLSQLLSLFLSLFLSLTGEDSVRTLASINHTCTLNIPHSVSQSACVIIILIITTKEYFVTISLEGQFTCATKK